jgi:hypothetical protein
MAGRKRTRPSKDTVKEERLEAKAKADAGREPTPDEEEAADRNERDERVSEHYEEMIERGAGQGERAAYPRRHAGRPARAGRRRDRREHRRLRSLTAEAFHSALSASLQRAPILLRHTVRHDHRRQEPP